MPALVGSRIEKIYQPAEGIVTFSLYGLGKIWQRTAEPPYSFSSQKYYLSCKGGKEAFLFLSHTRVSSGTEPPAFVMRLRKYLAGRHIKSAAADWLQRKIILEVQDVWLSLDLRNGLELHFSCPQGGICSSAANSALAEKKQDINADEEGREEEKNYLAFDESYRIFPSLADTFFADCWADFSVLSSCGESTVWKAYPTLTPLLRKTLPYLCAEEQAALYADLQYGGGDVFVYTENTRALKINLSVENDPLRFSGGSDRFFISAWKIPQELLHGMGYRHNTKELVFENSIDAFLFIGDMVLAKYRRLSSGNAVKQLQAQLKKLARLALKLEEEEDRLTRLAGMKRDALLLQANLYLFKGDDRFAEVCVLDAEGKECSVRLDKSKTVRENMENYFHAAARGIRGLEHLHRRKQELEFEKQAVLNRMWEEEAGAGIKEQKPKNSKPAEPDYGLLGKIKNVNKKGRFSRQNTDVGSKGKNAGAKNNGGKYPKEVQVFRSSDGFMILRGRDTKGNGLVLKMASSYDVWVHIAEGTSAHVIIKRDHAKQEIPPQTMQEAGSLALLKSRAKTEGSGLVQFSYAKYIRPMKNAPQGLVHVDKSEGTYTAEILPELEERLKI